MRCKEKTLRVLSSVLCACLLASAVAVPQASAANYEDTYNFSLDYSLISEIRCYCGSSVGGTNISYYNTTSAELSAYSGIWQYDSTSHITTVIFDGESVSDTSYGTSDSYPYATTYYNYLYGSPVSSGDSTWTFSLPAANDSYTIPYYVATYITGSGTRRFRTSGIISCRVNLLGYYGTAIASSGWHDMSTAFTYSFDMSQPVYGIRIDVATNAAYGSNQVLVYLGNFFTTVASVTFTDTDYNGYYQDVIDGLDGIDSSIQEGTNSIIDNLLSIPGMIVDGILGLFVPDADDLSGVYDDFSSLMEDKLGAIWQVGSIIGSFFEGLSTDEEINTISFPGISFPMNGETITIAASQSVQIVPDEIYNSDWYDMVRLAVTAVLVFAWVMGMEKMLERMLSPDGRSED